MNGGSDDSLDDSPWDRDHLRGIRDVVDVNRPLVRSRDDDVSSDPDVVKGLGYESPDLDE